MSEQINFKEFLNIYEFDTALAGTGEKVVYKPITTGQLKKLLTFENTTDPIVIDEALDELILSCVTSKDFNIKKLYLQDRFSLLVEIRKATKGTTYEFTYNCDKCKSQLFQVVDLKKLKVIPYPTEIDHKIKLTEDISINVDNIKREEQIKAFKYLPKGNLNDNQKVAEIAILTHAAGIKSIETPKGTIENVSIKDAKYLLENISTDAYDKIKDWYKEYDFGIDFTFNIKCNCGYKEKITIPLQNFFF